MRNLTTAALALALTALAGAAAAHTGEGIQGGLISGFTHPIYGWDHVVAMVAVGLWGAFLGKPAIWILPVVFPLVMALGAAAGIAGIPVPAVETGIALSGVVLGLMVALAVRAPLWVAAVMVGAFAIFHGHAHGAEFEGYATVTDGSTPPNPFAYAVGFVAGTGLLHLIGIGFGYLTKVPMGQWVIRAGGVAIAVVGAMFLTGYA